MALMRQTLPVIGYQSDAMRAHASLVHAGSALAILPIGDLGELPALPLPTPTPTPACAPTRAGPYAPPSKSALGCTPFFCAIEIVRILPFSELITCRAPQRLRCVRPMTHLWRGCAIAPLNYRRKFYGAPRFAPLDFRWRTYGALYGAYTYGCPSAENRPMRSLR